MEILTLIILLVVLGLVIRRRRKDQEIEQTNKLLAQVRLRSKVRQLERGNHVINDPYNMGIDFSTAIEATELDDIFDGRPALTEKQKETIELIFKEHTRTTLSMRTFDESDVTERIVLDDSWIRKT